ncbi:hypothetical protein ACIQXA_16445 [Streptomyces massasporeus]|uniref:hypothetical protein n=1 Tax=Streptomyces massasporeus TaxID=67324 RepID=UPI0037FDB33C
MRSVAARHGLTEIIWHVDSQDWNGASTDAIVQPVARLTDGQVILMHDWPANTLEAVPRIAQTLASRGLCAGTISPQTGRAVAPGKPGATATTAVAPPVVPAAGGLLVDPGDHPRLPVTVPVLVCLRDPWIAAARGRRRADT